MRSDTDSKVFVKLAGWTPTAVVLIKSTAKDRFLTGRCARVDATMAQGSPTSGSQPARSGLACTTVKPASAATSRAICCWRRARSSPNR